MCENVDRKLVTHVVSINCLYAKLILYPDFCIFQLVCNFEQAQAVTPKLCNSTASPMKPVLPQAIHTDHAYSMNKACGGLLL